MAEKKPRQVAHVMLHLTTLVEDDEHGFRFEAPNMQSDVPQDTLARIYRMICERIPFIDPLENQIIVTGNPEKREDELAVISYTLDDLSVGFLSLTPIPEKIQPFLQD